MCVCVCDRRLTQRLSYRFPCCLLLAHELNDYVCCSYLFIINNKKAERMKITTFLPHKFSLYKICYSVCGVPDGMVPLLEKPKP